MKVLPWILVALLASGWLLSANPQLLPFSWSEKMGLAHTERQKLNESFLQSGLDSTPLVLAWRKAGFDALAGPESVALPISRRLYFAHEPRAYGFRVDVKRGRIVTIGIEDDLQGGEAFVELFALNATSTSPSYELMAARPAGKDSLRIFEDEDVTLVIRVDVPPMVLGNVEIRVHSEPSLSVFPVKGAKDRDVGSVWGDPRDGGRRKHEGIDIFSAKGTPLLAATSGRISSVRNSGLGGKQVWLTTDDGFRLYYAHLDEQWVEEGEYVLAGEPLGSVGNTGNAQTTPPHLHFGIYTESGAVDPYPFVRQSKQANFSHQVLAVNADAQARIRRQTRLRETAQLKKRVGRTIGQDERIRVLQQRENATFVKTDDGLEGWLAGEQLQAFDTTLKSYTAKANGQLFSDAQQEAVAIAAYTSGDELHVLAKAEKGRWVRNEQGVVGYVR